MNARPTPDRPPKGVSFEQALELVLQGAERLGCERVGLAQGAGRVLAEDVHVALPVPPFTHSRMDGYAVASESLAGTGPWMLTRCGESRAGHPGPPLRPGSTCRIFTGAPLPEGADAVLRQEDVDDRHGTIEVRAAAPAGQHVRRRGAELPAGARVLAAGQRLTPGRLSLAATADRPELEVARAPQLSILSTGDELRRPGQRPSAMSIVESNSAFMETVAQRLGAQVEPPRLVPDDRARTIRALRRALRTSDVVVTVGGSSVGDHDHVRPALAALGVPLDFRGVRVRPGRPTAAGRTPRCRVLCLPGTPSAATLMFLLLAVPLLRALQGERPWLPREAPLRVVGSHRHHPGVRAYLPARLQSRQGQLCAVLQPPSSRGAVTGLAEADALVVVPAGRRRIRTGDRLPVVLLSEIGCG